MRDGRPNPFEEKNIYQFSNGKHGEFIPQKKNPFDYFNYFQLYDPHTCNFITVNVLPIFPTLLNSIQ